MIVRFKSFVEKNMNTIHDLFKGRHFVMISAILMKLKVIQYFFIVHKYQIAVN